MGAREQSQLGHQGGCDTINKTGGECWGEQVLWERPKISLSHTGWKDTAVVNTQGWNGWSEPSVELRQQGPRSLGGSVGARRRPEEGRPWRTNWGASRMLEQLLVLERGQVKQGLESVSWIWQVETSLVSMTEWLQNSGAQQSQATRVARSGGKDGRVPWRKRRPEKAVT